ncbi:MAG TPA: hypoxanthine phosphoribosyltransferase [Clostridia bacterium]|nr:hypoxanthine phosphoribosyltransferase [Clostridia bacterium]
MPRKIVESRVPYLPMEGFLETKRRNGSAINAPAGDDSAQGGSRSAESLIFRFGGDRGGLPFLTQRETSLAVESPFTIYLDGHEVVTLLATPTDVEDLALGYLCSEAIVDSVEDIKRIDVDFSGLIRVRTHFLADVWKKRLDSVGRRVLTSGCGANPHVFKALDFNGVGAGLEGRSQSHPQGSNSAGDRAPSRVPVLPKIGGSKVEAEVLASLAKQVGQASTLYRLTRGSHCAAIGSFDGALLTVREDIGRHNAVDKVLGYALRSGISPSDKIVLVTGRASSDIVAKCARLGFPFVVSRSAPTDLAVKAAHRSGITLVGLARGNSFEVFSHPHRLALSQVVNTSDARPLDTGAASHATAPPHSEDTCGAKAEARVTGGYTDDILTPLHPRDSVSPPHSDGLRELISPEALEERVWALGRQITNDYRQKRPVFVGVLQGSFMFMADLARAVEVPIETDFMAVSSYGKGTESNGRVVITKDLGGSIRDRDVLLVEDIVDTGCTLAYLLEHLSRKRPRSLKVCALLDKPSRRKVHVEIDYVGFTIPDVFVVGYGLDFGGLYRNLHGIYVGVGAVPPNVPGIGD